MSELIKEIRGFINLLKKLRKELQDWYGQEWVKDNRILEEQINGYEEKITALTEGDSK